MALRSTAVEGRLAHAGEPLAGLEVRLVGLADSLVWAEVRTGADGRFRILHVPPGGYALTAGERTLRFLTVPGFQALDLGSFELEPGGF
ncbi:MAG: carboxypeptidase regulatory-like domain-containing protein [Thermoanaerobaculia bacterium]|nr:carboxypeptidase regulatory-like domain-containing protein [Thermoanaerobaculia bacterium]